MSSSLKQSDQVRMLEACARYTDHADPIRMFSYPACGWDLVQLGLVTQDCRITTAGRAALFLLGRGEDPLPESKAALEFSIPSRSTPHETDPGRGRESGPTPTRGGTS